MARRALAVVLAAGEGTRMKSDLPKVLHPIANRPMVCHVIAACREAGIEDVAVVVGSQAELVERVIAAQFDDITFHRQTEQRGTAHAVLCARDAIRAHHDEIVVLFGDVPLISPEAIETLRDAVRDGAHLAVLGFETDDPHGYGRLVIEDGTLVRIVEERDANEKERLIGLCSSGLMAFAGADALPLLDAVESDNAQNEFYLPDTVAIAHGKGLRADAVRGEEEQTLGVNDRVQLADREARWQRRARDAAMRAGVSMQAPETVWLSADTRLARDVHIEPNVWIGPGTSVGRGTRLRAGTHLEGATIGADCEIGPYARLRPGADLRDGVKVGNFVEAKKSVLREGSKVNHLTYVGDSDVGARANIGAGVVTANYDGYGKYRTIIEDQAFVGTNSTLVAPVTVGARANIAAGSVITNDVPADSLSFGRARQIDKEGRARTFREDAAKRKAASNPK